MSRYAVRRIIKYMFVLCYVVLCCVYTSTVHSSSTQSMTSAAATAAGGGDAVVFLRIIELDAGAILLCVFCH